MKTWKPILVVVGLLLVGAAVADPVPDPLYYNILVHGAWNGTGEVHVNIEAIDESYRVEIPRGISLWKDAIDAYADQTSRLNLHSLRFNTSTPLLPHLCRPDPPPDPPQDWRQQLWIPDVGNVCILPPNSSLLPDVIIVDAPLGPATIVALGVTGAPGILLWRLRQEGIPAGDGSYVGPVLVVVTTTDSQGELPAVDKFNIAVHEFGHAFGIGHTDHSGSPLDADIMYDTYYPHQFATYRCVSTLDLEAVWEAYQWLGGTFRTPMLTTRIQIRDYNPLAHC